MRRPIVARSVLGEKVCIGVFSRDVGWQRVASFLFCHDRRLYFDCRIVGVFARHLVLDDGEICVLGFAG